MKNADDRLARLVRKGLVRDARGTVAKQLFTTSPPRGTKGVSGVRALIQERREGR
jgi:hypothetical protein